MKTPARFHTDLFCSLFRDLRPLASEKIAKNFALRDCLQKFAGFSRGLGRLHPFIRATVGNGRPLVAAANVWESEGGFAGGQ
jgi:hypothetical protein